MLENFQSYVKINFLIPKIGNFTPFFRSLNSKQMKVIYEHFHIISKGNIIAKLDAYYIPFMNSTLREILLVVLTKGSQLFIFSKQYQKFCKTYQCSKVYETKYATIVFFFVKVIKFI